MMAEVRRYILDASVATKWLLRLADEPHSEHAALVLEAYQQDRVHLLAPEHINYEIGHALHRAVRRDRITAEQGRSLLSLFYSLQVPTTTNSEILLHAWTVADRFGCSFYDGVYLALSELSGIPFLHADYRLRNMLHGRFPLARWIEDYQ
ncbi:MAG: type II toxin-antitoxin system VapC family toxin [Chloroflexota bacterium]